MVMVVGTIVVGLGEFDYATEGRLNLFSPLRLTTQLLKALEV